MKLSKSFLAILKALLVALFFLALAKALLSSLTHDEAYTYMHHASGSFIDILTFSSPSANNHFLNTLLAKLSITLFGHNDIALRLPNIIAFLFFLVAFYKWILSQTSNITIVLLALGLLFFNPFLFNFFSLSRGYGLSILFSFLAITNLLHPQNDRKLNHDPWLFIWLTLMVLANFSTIVLYASIMLSYFIINTLPDPKEWRFWLKKTLKPVLILWLIIIYPVFKLITHHQLYWGGEIGFYEDTLFSLYFDFIYNLKIPDIYAIFIYGFILLLGLYTAIRYFNGRQKKALTPSVITLLILTSTIAINISLHVFFGYKYLIHRTALVYYLPIMMFVIHFILTNQSTRKYGKTLNVLFVLIFCALTFHFANSYHLKVFKSWTYDSRSKEVAFGLNELGNAENTRLEVGTTFIYKPTLSYYIKTRELQWASLSTIDELNNTSDFYYLSSSDTLNFVASDMILIKEYPLSQTKLYINPSSPFYDSSKAYSAPITLQLPRWDF